MSTLDTQRLTGDPERGYLFLDHWQTPREAHSLYASLSSDAELFVKKRIVNGIQVVLWISEIPPALKTLTGYWYDDRRFGMTSGQPCGVEANAGLLKDVNGIRRGCCL